MIFNRWKKYPKHEPEENDWYQCTIVDGRVMDLYFLDYEGGMWIDMRRTSVFDGYKVYKPSREPLEYNRVWTDSLCDWTIDVVAWRKLPKPYGFRRKK